MLETTSDSTYNNPLVYSQMPNTALNAESAKDSQCQRVRATVLNPPSSPPTNIWELPDGSTWCTFYKEAEAYRMRFPDLADFIIHRSGEVECQPAPGTDEPTLQHLYLNQVIPAVLSQQGHAVFHGSGVSIDGTAIAFIGISGRGKSTLATHLSRHGGALLTDDGLQLELLGDDCLVVPSQPHVRLWDDSRDVLLPPNATPAPAVSYTTKECFQSEGLIPFADAPTALKRAYFLGDGSADELTITPLTGQAAHMAWVQHSFILDPHDKVRMALHFQQVGRLVSLGISYRLDYPRRYELLPEVAAAIREHAGLAG